MAAQPRIRVHSTPAGTRKYWLYRMRATIAAMEKGRITSAECNRRITAYKDALATMISLKALELNGIADEIDNEVSATYDEAPLVASERVITTKRGTSSQGAPIDETTVVIHETVPSKE